MIVAIGLILLVGLLVFFVARDRRGLLGPLIIAICAWVAGGIGFLVSMESVTQQQIREGDLPSAALVSLGLNSLGMLGLLAIAALWLRRRRAAKRGGHEP